MAATSTIPAVVATPARGQVQQERRTPRTRLQARFPRSSMAPGQDSVAVSVDPRIITKILHSDSGHNTIFDLDVTGSATVKAMIVDWQHEPHQGRAAAHRPQAHCDGQGDAVSVPIQLVGVPVGVKSPGRHSGACAARGRDRVPPRRHSEPSRRRRLEPRDQPARSTSPICRTPARSSSSATRGLTVAHVAAIREEVVEPEAVDATQRRPNPKLPRRARAMTEAAPMPRPMPRQTPRQKKK